MNKRVRNFNPGPAALPEEVLLEAKEELTDYRGTGMSIMEMSHRSPEYEELHEETMSLILELLGLPDSFKVVFMGGGASTQFALIPLNWLALDRPGSYVLTGSFSEKAYQEAAAVGKTHIAATTQASGWSELGLRSHDLE
jgi:phosphoserine aminotransferase